MLWSSLGAENRNRPTGLVGGGPVAACVGLIGERLGFNHPDLAADFSRDYALGMHVDVAVAAQQRVDGLLKGRHVTGGSW